MADAKKDFLIAIETTGDVSGVDLVLGGLERLEQRTREASERLTALAEQGVAGGASEGAAAPDVSAAAEQLAAMAAEVAEARANLAAMAEDAAALAATSREAAGAMAEQAEAQAEVAAGVDAIATSMEAATTAAAETAQSAEALGSTLVEGGAAAGEMSEAVEAINKSLADAERRPKDALVPERSVQNAERLTTATRDWRAEWERQNASINEFIAAHRAAEEAAKSVHSIEEQRAILAEQQVELAQAKAEGDAEGARWMEREIEIRKQAINLQRQTAMTESEAMEVATRKVEAEFRAADALRQQAEEAKRVAEETKKAEASAKKKEGSWRQVLGRIVESTTGLTGMQTQIQGMIGSAEGLATRLAVPLTAGYAAWKLIIGAADKHNEQAVTQLRLSNELQDIREKIAQLQHKSAEELKQEAESARQVIKGLNRELQEESIKSAGVLGEAWAFWKGVIPDSAKRAITEMGDLMSKADDARVKGLGEQLKLEVESLDPLKKKVELNEQLVKTAEDLLPLRQEVEKTSAKQVEHWEEGEKALERNVAAIKTMAAEAEKAAFDKLTAPERWARMKAEVEDVRAAINSLLDGGSASSPLDAILRSEDLLMDQQHEVGILAERWAMLQKGIRTAEEEIAETTKRRMESIASLRAEIEGLSRSLERLKADMADMEAEGNTFAQARWQTLGGVEQTGWFRTEDTVKNASGQVMPVDPARAVAANDPELVRYQQLAADLAQTNQQLSSQQTQLSEATSAAAAAAGQVASSTAAVGEATQQTAEAATGFGTALAMGMAQVNASLTPLPAQIETSSAQQVAAVQALGGSINAGFASVTVTIQSLNTQIGVINSRLAGLERAVAAR